jgi:glycerol kinase
MSGRGFVLAIDQGTTSTRAIVFDAEGRPRASAQVPLTQIYPAPGEVEHDPEEIWQSVLKAGRAALKDIGAQSVAAIGITNQRETTVVWERATGKPLANAIVWQDRRTAGHCDELKSEGWSAHVEETTGLVIDPYFSATKLAWLLANVPGLGERGAQRRGMLRHGRQLSPVQADGRQGACDRSEQRWPHHALRHPVRGLGREASRSPRHPARSAAGASRQPGRFRSG